MGVVIKPAGVLLQLKDKSCVLEAVIEECSARRRACGEFCAGSLLSGEAWDAARSRIGRHAVLYAGLSEAVRMLDTADGKVASALSSGFGAVGEVREDEWADKRDEAQRMLNRLDELGRSPYAADPGFAAGLWSARVWWRCARREAQDMLDRIGEYLAATNGVYGPCYDVLSALSRGVSSLSRSGFSGSGWPDEADADWADGLRGLLASGIGFADDLYRDGTLDDDALCAIFDRPAELWTDGEIAAICALYGEAGIQAVEGDSSLLERFLNDGYFMSEAPHNVGMCGQAGIVGATFSMRDGFRGFLASYVTARTAEAYYADAPLSAPECLLAATSQGLLVHAPSFEVGRVSGGSGSGAERAFLESFAPNVRIEYNKTEAARGGDGRDREHVYTKVTFGSCFSPSAGSGKDFLTSNGFVAMTASGNLNAAYSDLRDTLAVRTHKNPAEAAAESLTGAAVGRVAEAVLGPLSVAYEAGSATIDALRAASDQAEVNSSINTTLSLDDQDSEMSYRFYESGTLVADLKGGGVQVVAPGFADDADRSQFERAWAQYRYDNTNGDGKVYDSYKAWAEAEPEGGVTMLNEGQWKGEVIKNYDVLTNPDELVWCNPAPMNGGDAR